MLDCAARRFLRRVAAQTGIPLLDDRSATSPATLTLTCRRSGDLLKLDTVEESYTLRVTGQSATLDAPTTVGVLRGMETFLQMIELGPSGFRVPAATVADAPRFPWRGLMLDVSRHFMPLPVLRRNIDAMAAAKFNVLHLHLSDDQGFRIESKVFPKLHQMGSDGQFYTQDQMRGLIAYARDRGLRIVPEFDVPGHTTAWFAGHPELASQPGPYKIERGVGVFDPAIDPTREESYAFLERLFTEMAGLFPDPYFHIGGDEVNGKDWNRSERIQKFIAARGLKNNQDLEAWFSSRMVEIVTKQQKIAVGWDEILQPGLPTGAVIQSWRGAKSLAEAARQGHHVLLSSGYYLDLMLPASTHYAADPQSGEAAALKPAEAARILGGEACMWTEWASPENLDMRLWPRAAAIAERLWSPAQGRDVNRFYDRLDAFSRHLERAGSTHRVAPRRMRERLAGGVDAPALNTLADVVEPVKNYRRGSLQVYRSDLPLNRLVDSVPPESDSARRFSADVDRALAAGAQAPEWASIRARLTAWRDNHTALKPLIARSGLLTEIGPVSEALEEISAIALQAVEYHTAKAKPPAGWAALQAGKLANPGYAPLKPDIFVYCVELQKRHNSTDAGARKICTIPAAAGGVLIAVAPPIRKLVETTKK